jgi:hypothetical protein
MRQLSTECACGDGFWVIFSQRPRADFQGMFSEGERLAQVALLLPEDRQVMQGLTYQGMVLTQV